MKFQIATYVVILFVFCDLGICLENDNKDLDRAIPKLASDDYLVATKAFEILFNSGQDAMPYILSGFLDIREYKGLCGQLIRTSEFSFETIDSEEDRTNTYSENHSPIKVREICLYLMLAIYKNNMYFSDSCILTVAEGDREENITKALSETIYEYTFSLKKGNSEFNLSKMESILAKWRISFK